MDTLYAELNDEITTLAPTCWNKGDCCRFGAYGHRLYVTTLELMYFAARLHAPGPPSAGSTVPHEPGRSLPVLAGASLEMFASAFEADRCPYATGGRCQAREARPLGCRIFYCDPGAQSWQGPVTERYLARLRTLHEQFEVPYYYADWMKMLRGLADQWP